VGETPCLTVVCDLQRCLLDPWPWLLTPAPLQTTNLTTCHLCNNTMVLHSEHIAMRFLPTCEEAFLLCLGVSRAGSRCTFNFRVLLLLWQPVRFGGCFACPMVSMIAACVPA